MCELSKWDKAAFVTLTYNEENLPRDLSLSKRDLQLFNKRLRNHVDFKFYACGEYGAKGRPHYHGIYFGLDPFSCHEMIRDCWRKCDAWQFDKRRGIKCAVGQVTRESMQYVVGYVQKKLFGSSAAHEYGNRQRPFALMSKGLGRDFGDDNSHRFVKGWTYLNSQRIGIPRYFRDRYGIEIKDGQVDAEIMRIDFDASIHKFYELYPAAYKMGLTARSRAFERWYDEYELRFADRIFRDYQDRLRVVGGKV